MARIRTIKPEFPHSESMGRVSRDARLLFVQLWTLCDDEGRARGASKLLARLLYPYDDDAPGLIDGWLDELEREGCVLRYEVDGGSFVQVCNWTTHQKIDKPGKSKFPAPDGAITPARRERDMELELVTRLKSVAHAFGGRVLDVQRQVRIGSSYLDVVVTTDAGAFVLELKRDRLTAADVRQVTKYAELSGAKPVLVGPGLSPQFKPAECMATGVAVLLWPEGEPITLAIASEHVTARSITFANVIERQSLDQGSRIKDQGSGSRSEERAGAGADTHAGARDGPADAEDPEPAARTPAGEICFALRRAGIASVQPSHPLLLALIEAGAEPSEFLAAVPDAQSRSNGFAYLLAVVRGRREDAARAAQSLHRGPMPRTETPYERRARERAEAYAPGIAARAPGAPMRTIVDLQEAPANVPLIQGH